MVHDHQRGNTDGSCTPIVSYLLGTMVCMGEIGCQLRRPNTIPSHMIEPQVLEPPMRDSALPVTKASSSAIPMRLMDTQPRGHIGRRLLHQQPNGGLTEGDVWRWSSAPDRT